MADGRIKDQKLRATSSRGLANPIHARLNHTGGYGGWCPDQKPYENETDPIYREFLQVELDIPLRIKGIVTQGRDGGIEKVERYWISYSTINKQTYKWFYVGRTHVVKVCANKFRYMYM